MNFTVSSPGDPHRDSCAKLGEANPPRNKSARRNAGIIDADLIALGCFRLYFTGIAGQAFSSLRIKTPWMQVKTDIDGYRAQMLKV
jgi:hypothetical protein